MERINLSIGILTWKSQHTLLNTLLSYQSKGLLNHTDDIILYAQEISDMEYIIAEKFNIKKVLGNDKNIGIGRAFSSIVHNSKYDTIHILENDWVLMEDEETTYRELKAGVDNIESGKFDFVRFRHAKFPGDPLYTYQFRDNEMNSPEHLLDAVHWNTDINLKFPKLISKVKDEINGTEYLVTDSHYGNHTNNPFMCSKEFFIKHIEPFSGEGVALEGGIRDYWRNRHFTVAHSTKGLYTHYRLDR